VLSEFELQQCAEYFIRVRESKYEGLQDIYTWRTRASERERARLCIGFNYYQQTDHSNYDKDPYSWKLRHEGTLFHLATAVCDICGIESFLVRPYLKTGFNHEWVGPGIVAADLAPAKRKALSRAV
jgi:hypothetical protein